MAQMKVIAMAVDLEQNSDNTMGWRSVKMMGHWWWESNLAYLMAELMGQRLEDPNSLALPME